MGRLSAILDADQVLMVNDASDFDVSLQYDGPDPDDTTVVFRQGDNVIDLSPQDALEAALAVIEVVAPWKLR